VQSSILYMLRVKNGLSELREERGWTQAELAAAVGVSRQSINAIEKYRNVASLELALRLSNIFECPADEIFWLAEES
jgi:putative transcriptional regulator